MKPSYYNNVNPDLLAAIPLHATKVLELGAGAGALGAAFKRRNPQANWIGVELMQEPAAMAAERLDEIYVADVESDRVELPWASWHAAMDAIVLGDILEHLKDPWAMLSRLAACLSPDGVLLACIPNVGHWTVIDGLLRGDFSYRDQGLLDRTHLRFFTASSMLELFQRAGLAASKMRAREIVVNKEGFEAFVESMKPWIASAAEDLAVVRQRWLSLQYVIRAVPSARLGISQLPGAKAPQEAKAIPGAEAIRGGKAIPEPSAAQAVRVRSRASKLVIVMLAMAPGFADVRTRLPLLAFGSLVDVEVHYFERSAQIPDLPLDLPKVLIVQRQLPSSLVEWQQTVQRLEAKGWLVLAEWDDHPSLFAPRIKEHFDRAPWASVKAAHGVVTSTPRLAKEIAKVRGDDRILLFDNRLIELPPLKSSPTPVGAEAVAAEKIAVFFGALNRTQEGIELMRAIAPVFRAYPQAELVVLQDRAVFEAASVDQKRFVPQLSYDQYHQLLAQCHIALLPLADHEGNACKSDLKFIECAAHEMACIASPTVYAASIDEGMNGLIAADVQEFAVALEDLIKNHARRRAIAQSARQYVSEHRLWSQVLTLRVEALEQAWRQWRKLHT